jgi:hypothetical protein
LREEATMSWLKKQVGDAWRLVAHPEGHEPPKMEPERKETLSSREPREIGSNDSAPVRAHEYGTLIAPLAPVGLEGRTDEQVEADNRRLAWIEKHLLPTDLVREAVERFLGRIAKTAVHGALGPPELIQQLLLEASTEQLGELPKQSREEFQAELSELRARLDEHHSRFAEESLRESTAQSTLEEEYEIAKKELVRHWASLVSSAVMLWGERDPVRFDHKLRPLPPADQKDSWRELFEETRDSLYAAVAIDRDDMSKITGGFASALREHTRAGRAVELPDRIDVIWKGSDIAALQRRAT